MNGFLTDKASFFHQVRLGLTSVVMHAQFADEVLEYFTLSNDAIQRMTSEELELAL